MRNFILAAVAIVGVSVLGTAGTVQAGQSWGPGHSGYNHGSPYRGGYGYNAGYRGGYLPPRPIYGPPVYRPVPAPIVPVYGGYPAYGYGAPGFGISTPGFGLYIR